MRVYFDNMLVTYLADYESGRMIRGDLAATVDALEAILGSEVEVLLSEETLAEIGKRAPGAKRSELSRLFHRLKAGRSVIRNSAVTYGDQIATYRSLDVYWRHPYTDDDLDRVKSYLTSVGNDNEMDARYIANAMLVENAIDVFLTYDKKSIWRHRDEIQRQFGVTVLTPEELAESLPT